MLNKSLLKIICIFSFIIGAILGLIPLIPSFIWISFILLMFFVSPFVIIYMERLNLIKKVEIEQSLIIGAVSGAVSSLGFLIVFLPIAFILNLIFKIQSFLWIKVLFQNFVFLVPMILFITLLGALLNTFSGFLTAYFYQYLKK